MDLNLYRPVHQLITERVARHPERAAVVFNGETVSYGELHRRAMAVAGRLRDLGVQRNDLVGVHVERSVSMLAAILGIHLAGAAYVPLDPSFPAERLQHILDDAGLRYLVHAGTPRLAALPRHCVDVLTLDPQAAAGAIDLAQDGDPTDLAYVMYTSGSTGKPKGVRVHHGAVLNFLRSMAREPGLAESDTLVAVTTPSFDISVLELFLPLVMGARIALATKEETVNGEKLARLIAASNATVMQATPATWRMLFLTGWAGAPGLKVLCGGESLDSPLARKLHAAVAELWNMYGPTETTVWSTCCRIEDPSAPISVGRPILETTVHVLDEAQQPLPAGQTGELYIGGAGVTLGYTQEALTIARFVPDPFSAKADARLYRTGDLAMLKEDGLLYILGRIDEQVKVRGFRVELNDVQQHLLDAPGVEQGAVIAHQDTLGENQLVAYVVASEAGPADLGAIKAFLSSRLPDYMVPTRIVVLDTLPLTPNGKVDKKRLAAFEVDDASDDEAAVAGDLRTALTTTVARLLKTATVDAEANLFDLGIDSLQANYIAATVSRQAGIRLSVGEVFEHPSINALLRHQDDKNYLRKLHQGLASRRRRAAVSSEQAEAIAIVGMAGRFPGADTVEDLWTILSEGRETVTRFTPEQDDPAVEEEVRNHPGYVRVRGMIRDPEMFDAQLFGISPNDAAAMDPQQRVFLELAWEALERAGCDPDRFDGLIGVYAGMGNNFYYFHNVSTRPEFLHMVGEVQAEIGREKDHVATLVSHKLNLTGPSLSVHTACSTGLVCIDSAVQSLLSRQCDVAVAGAIELRTPQMSGQIHEPSGIFTGDGHCRPFSSDASGTMFSDGAGVLVLKRLSDAVEDGDTVHALIRGSAVNHDGYNKKSYLAPSVKGQMEVMALAQARAGVSPASITYMEAHGTATPVGDPIEFQALRNIFEFAGSERNHCALGSVKGNLGHPTTAAGAVGVIKTALAMTHRTIPPLANFTSINPNIDIENSPFYITTRAMDWDTQGQPRRAGVSSFGFCGTNAHVVMEEAPVQAEPARLHERPFYPVLLSANSESALKALASRMEVAAAAESAAHPADMAFTLAAGRKRLKQRSFTLLDATRPASGFQDLAPMRKATDAQRPEVAYVFPGQGAQYLDMGRDLYEVEPVFRAAFDRCAELLAPHLGLDLRHLVLGMGAAPDTREERLALLNSTHITQPAMFSLGYALAMLWTDWGVKPSVLMGHSVGEYVCAVLAGVFSLEDGARLIAARGRLMGSQERGKMLSVRLSQEALQTALQGQEGLSIAAINSPTLCVVAGPEHDVARFQQKLDTLGVRSQLLHTSHAFHSWMMEAAVPAFLSEVKSVALSAPSVPIISTVTGSLLTGAQATDPDYWAGHIMRPVRFSEAIRTLWTEERRIALELGPRATMSSLAAAQTLHKASQFAIPSLSDTSEDHAECRSMATAIGQLWQHQVELDWEAYFRDTGARRVVLPTYPFERKRYWVEPARTERTVATAAPVNELLAAAQEEPTASSSDAQLDGITRQLRAILEEVSGEDMQEAPVDASFLELGLDSLLLTPIIYLVKERFGVVISFRQLLNDLSSIEKLSAHVAAQRSPRAEPATAPPDLTTTTASAAAVADSIATTPAQRALLNAERKDAQQALAHLESVSISLNGALDKAALEAAVGELVSAHDTLRAQFSADGQSMRVVPALAGQPAIRWLTMQPAAIPGWIAQEMQQPLDLSRAPLLRVAVLSANERTHTVVMTTHAAVCDRWSLDVLIEELAQAYGRRAGATGAAPATAAEQFREYVTMLTKLDAEASARRAYWQTELGKAARPLPRAATAELQRITFHIDRSQLSSLKQASNQHQLSLYTTLFGTLCAVLRRQAGNGESLVVATPFAGQSSYNMPRLVGACTHVLPIVLEPEAPAPLQELLHFVQKKLLAAYENQYSPEAELAGLAFVHTKRLKTASHTFHGLHSDYQFNERARESFDATFEVLEYDDRLVISCTSRGGSVYGAPVAAVQSAYETLLRQMAADAAIRPEEPVAALATH